MRRALVLVWLLAACDVGGLLVAEHREDAGADGLGGAAGAGGMAVDASTDERALPEPELDAVQVCPTCEQ